MPPFTQAGEHTATNRLAEFDQRERRLTCSTSCTGICCWTATSVRSYTSATVGASWRTYSYKTNMFDSLWQDDNLHVAHVEPVYVDGQAQVLGAEQVPPFKQDGEQTAKT